jgi:hypothetical protein
MAVHTQNQVSVKLEKPRGIEGMTWKLRTQRAAFALAIVGTLGVASGAGWFENFRSFVFGLLS